MPHNIKETLYNSEIDESKCDFYCDENGQMVSGLLSQVVDKWSVVENGFNNAFVGCYSKSFPGDGVVLPSNEFNETVPKVDVCEADCGTNVVGLYFLM